MVLLALLALSSLEGLLLSQDVKRTFAELPEDILNPERGSIYFARIQEGPRLDGLRERGFTTVFSGVVLADFRTKPIDDAFLAKLTKGFEDLRAAGLKTVLRFMYSRKSGDPDAPLEWVLKHVAQLKPLIQDNVDVIAVVQAGFIGSWGEWHGSSNKLDQDGPRRELLTALLDAVPASRMIQVRTPMFKKRLFGDAPISEAEAWKPTPRARIAHHNDAFFAGPNDHGTYADPVDTWKDWLEQETRFGPYFAETFEQKTPDPKAFEAELERFRTSFLHLRFEKRGLEAWEKSGVLGKLKQRLGYRFVLTEATATPAIKPGGDLKLSFTVRNDGFAPPFNPRPLQVVLSDGRQRFAGVAKSVDVRRWAPGRPINVSIRMSVPGRIPAGKYRLSLALPDDAPSIAARPEYAIRFANEGTWEAKRGENVLFEEVRVDAFAPGLANPAVKEMTEVR